MEQNRDEAILAFEKANRLLDANHALAAGQKYDAILVNYPNSTLDTIVLFNAGIAYLNAKECQIASERFRRLIRSSSANSSPTMRNRAQLKMSDVYTCLGEDNKAIVNLVELYINKNNFPADIGKAEIPAKLAAAYARIGNNKEAERYFKLAERGLISVHAGIVSPKEKRDALAQTLFQMGSLNQINVQTMPPDDYFATIQALQKYLFKSVELDSTQWSQLSTDQIELAYENVWKYIENAKPEASEDKVKAERDALAERVRVAQMALITLYKLKELRIPAEQESELVLSLLKKIKKHEIKIRNYIATNILGTSLTQEALEAQSVKRVGRVLNPDPIFERSNKIKKSKE